MKIDTIILFLLMLALASCGDLQKSDQKIELVRKPYLQSAISDSISILWRTNSGDNSNVRYRLKGSKGWSAADGITRRTNTNVVEYEVTLLNLKPGTNYEYQIYTGDQQFLVDQNLYFPSPVDPKDTVFSFFAVGDIGEPVEEGGTPDALANALVPYVDSFNFGLLLGDIIYPDGKSEDYDPNLFQYFGAVFPYVPVFTILGNHDWHEPEENYVKEWKLPGNEHYYSFDYGNVHFVGLDTKMGDVLYDSAAQVNWLEADLAKVSDEQDWKVVFLHHNGRSCTYKDDYKAVVGLYPIFEKYGVDLVLNGHAHTYERLNPMDGEGQVVQNAIRKDSHYQNPEGFISITAGSGGKLRGVGTDPKPFSPDPDNCKYPNLVAAFSHTWAFLTIKVEGKTLKGTAMATKDGKVVDQFKISK